MRTVKDPQVRRNEILDTAERLFSTKGFARATVNEILDEIGIAKGTFYYYFKSKEEVLDAIVDRAAEVETAAAAEVAESSELSVHEKLYMVLMVLRPKAAGGKQVMLDELRSQGNAELLQKSIVQSILRMTPLLAQIVEQGIAEGAFDTPCPTETVECLLVSSQFLLDEGIFGWDSRQLEEKSKAFISIMEKSLGAEPGSFSSIYAMVTGQMA